MSIPKKINEESLCPLCAGTALESLYEKDRYALVQCRECRSAHVANPPTDKKLSELYSFKDGYQQWYTKDGSYVREFSLAHRRYSQMKQLSGLQSGRVLDIGCSVGFFLKVAKDKGWTAEGVELSPDTAAIAQKRYGLNVRVGRLEDQKFAEKFDLITMWDLIEHVRSPRMLLNKATELLRPGGTICIATPNLEGIFPRASYLVAKAINYWPHPEPPLHLFQFSETGIKRLLHSTGFAVNGIIHERIPLRYSFGGLQAHRLSPKRIPYSIIFAPIALMGPYLNRGDSITVVAQLKSK